MNPNQIVSLRLFSAESEFSQPIADATHHIPGIRFLIAEIQLANGITGQGYLLSFHFFPKGMVGAIQDMETFIQDFRADQIKAMQQAFALESEYYGHEGLLKWVQAILNLAMWDAWGKVQEQPVWKLLGGTYKSVPVYGSGGWLSYSDKQLLDEVSRYRDQGFKAVKIKVGAKEDGRDIHRLRLVREILGPEVKIMMDANQGMSVEAALALAEAAAPLGIEWFEEPIDHLDYEGYAKLRREAGMLIAMGEREYSTAPLEALIRREAIHLWQPDLLRLGGVEAWCESAALAHRHKIPVLPHYYKDYDVPLLCTIPNGMGAESFDWIDGLIDNRMEISQGMALPRRTPGWGFSFLHDKMSEV